MGFTCLFKGSFLTLNALSGFGSYAAVQWCLCMSIYKASIQGSGFSFNNCKIVVYFSGREQLGLSGMCDFLTLCNGPQHYNTTFWPCKVRAGCIIAYGRRLFNILTARAEEKSNSLVLRSCFSCCEFAFIFNLSMAVTWTSLSIQYLPFSLMRYQDL